MVSFLIVSYFRFADSLRSDEHKKSDEHTGTSGITHLIYQSVIQMKI